MSEMEQQIITAIIEMVRDGGKYAIVGLITWFIYQLARIGLIGGLIWVVVRYMGGVCVSLYRTYKETYKEVNNAKITLISEECSRLITQSLHDLCQEVKSIQAISSSNTCKYVEHTNESPQQKD